MSEGTDNLVLEHLRHIRGVVDGVRDDVRELKHRMSAVELGLASVRREIANVAETIAYQQIRIEKVEDRLERIERRLDVVPAQG